MDQTRPFVAWLSSFSPCHPTFTDRKVSRPKNMTFSRPKFAKNEKFCASFTDQVQRPILNNSHAYPFCKTMRRFFSLVFLVSQLFSIGHCTIFCQCNLLKTVAKLFNQWKWRCTHFGCICQQRVLFMNYANDSTLTFIIHESLFA